MAEMGCVKPRFGEFDVHEVTSPCSLVADPGRVAVAFPIFAGPCRFTREVVVGQGVGIQHEQHRDLGAGSLVEVVLGDQGNDFVTLITPSECGMRRRHRDSKKKAADGRRKPTGAAEHQLFSKCECLTAKPRKSP